MSTSALNQLRKLQQSLYDKAYEEAHSVVVGSASRALLAYSRKFERSLPRRYQLSNLSELIEVLRSQRIVLYGDFHTLRQSQRGLLRLMRRFSERQKSRKVVLALEMFKTVEQDYLDAYMAGKLDERDFLASIDYAREWGFPWKNFRMFLDYARAAKIPVFGINTDNGGRDRLAERDVFAADKLLDLADKYKEHTIFCLIGEYHLADAHLPHCLRKAASRRKLRDLSILRILNNVDHYYFRLHQGAHINPTEYLKLKSDLYCVMNSPPWMKWQSFSMWEEARHAGIPNYAEPDSDMDQDLDLSAEESFDVDYQLLTLIKNLANFLDITIDESDVETFHVHLSPDGDFFGDLTQDMGIEPGKATRIIARASVDGVYFVPQTNTVLLTYLSINNLAEAAGQYLYAVLGGNKSHDQSADREFFANIMKSVVAVIASKVLNPKRKSMELYHWRLLLKRLKGKRLAGKLARQRTIATGILQFERWLHEINSQDPNLPLVAPRALLIRDLQLDYELSREIGQVLGYSFYKKVLANKVATAKLRRFFRRKLNSDTAFRSAFAELYEML